MSIGPQLQKKWDWRAASNFICGGSGSGLLLAAAALLLTGLDTTGLALPAALLVAAGLGLVWLEIGRKARFLNVFHNPRTSWMSREAIVALVLLPLAALATLTGSAPLLLITVLPAALFLYSQGRILKASHGIPAWRAAEIVPLIITTGLTEGTGLLLILLALFDRIALPGAFISTLVITLALYRLFAWRCYTHALRRGAPSGVLPALAPASIILTLLGTALPVISALLITFEGEQQRLLIVTAGVGMVLGGWIAKFFIITRAAFNQGYAIPLTPARGGGSIGPGSKPGWQFDHRDQN